MRLIDADALKAKQQEDADLFINAVSLVEKARRDEALNAVANIVNAPTIDDGEMPIEVLPMTNGNRIRQMTNKDLAEYIRVFFPEVCPPGNCPGEDSCYKCWLDWLKQEAEDDEG